MLANFHTHTSFCDGKDSAEDMVIAAIENGFDALGFSGHGYTDFDTSYCMTDSAGYISEIKRLKEKYKDKIEIYIGCEEDMLSPICRKDYDYIIGSSHYYRIGSDITDVDASIQATKKALKKCGGDERELARIYYEDFTNYILSRKPDIVGHFDILTKFDECAEMIFSQSERYRELSEKYLLKALQSGCIFEVNTGAISRGYKKSPYPSQELLHIMKKNDAKIILSSDAHSKDALSYNFSETARLLFDIGFRSTYTISGGKFVPVDLKTVF